MAKAKKKLLPKNFEDLLKAGDLAQLQTVFETCDINARGGSAKETALAFDDCSPELERWLVAEGADLSASDVRGNTPLHSRARSRLGSIAGLLELGADLNSNASIGTPLHAAADSYNVPNARLLVERGADVNALNRDGLTPLELALRRCRNVDLEDMAPLAELLLAAGASTSPAMKQVVAELGKTFEFHRSAFNPDLRDAASAGLNRLYELFGAAPVAPRLIHDGTAPIAVQGGSWQEQHDMLWAFLVPSSGPAATVQGEVIRISGRIANELEGNGGVNWDADYKAMAEAFVKHLALAEPASELVKDSARMAQLAVAWVAQHPVPIPLGRTEYKR
ncbi:ankyrin repeat domain-containing protein [Pseudoduganella violaceinigra]|uniref:ankyrin repeat domain-containing protein n=1 Tax=Pseudoduganella violaceinigra TaxID=246602 RepID=UPI0003F70100|nr:ankyrin repeat domain-containing protein [Pseudoduganella violaceinigra]